MNEAQFKNDLYENGIQLNDKQMDQFNTYYELLVEWNQKINITALTEKKDVYLKHFFDSITAAFYYDFTQDIHLCDVGAGAGFPSIPLKICFPHIDIVIVDSLKKRIDFLKLLGTELSLDRVSFYHARAEDRSEEHTSELQSRFDLVCRLLL